MAEKQASILIVDDDDTVRASLERVLVPEGYRVALSRSGVDAVNLLVKGEFELVMLDLRMPQLGGLTVLQHVRTRHPEIPVIVMTGFPSIENAKESIQLGAFDFVLKPIDPATTRQVVARALASSQWKIQQR